MANRETSIRSKIVPGKDLGNPKAVTLLPDGQNAVVMGMVLGHVEKIITRTMPTGEIYEGLSGFFEAQPVNVQLPIVQSGICYLPAGFFELVANPLKEAQKDKPGAALDFVFKVEAVKDGNPQGYSWRYTPLLAKASADPLSALRSSAGAPALEAPKVEPAQQTAKPVAEKVPAKK